ncbi:MAG: aminotransferase class III-fold pyridoxal phosphate-dependent enzyme [Acidobacteriota bacterium]|nr:MAG: aminotransferase class III-fold pyridoxal phosphate-dependent enzyme [Acidobacteriota bacterium]
MPSKRSPYRTYEKLLEDRFGIEDAGIGELGGYDARNFLVSAPAGKFVLKLRESQPNLLEELEAEARVLNRLSEKGIERIPNPVPGNDGSFAATVSIDGRETVVALFEYVEGRILGAEGVAGENSGALGDFLGKLDRELADCSEIVFEAKRSPWDLQHRELSYDDSFYISDPRARKYIDYFFLRADRFVDPSVPHLRRQLIHGDANEWNVLAGPDGRVSLIDFGDMCHSPLVNEVAIAACYVLLMADDVVTGALPLISAYCAVNPLNDLELSLLYDLIAIRACISVCRSARARQEMPENKYAQISDPLAWDFLQKWAAVSPGKIENAFRLAAGFEPVRSGPVEKCLKNRRANTSSALSLQFEEPIRMESAAFQYMFDCEGNTYLDCYNNIPHVGHCHPAIADTLSFMSMTLNTNTRYLTLQFDIYSAELLELFPESLNKVFFVNSGSAATDLALRLVRAHTNAEKVIVAEHGYHGNTSAAIEVSHYKYAGKGGPGKPGFVIEAPIPNALRDGDAKRDFFRELVARVEAHGTDVAAFIAEPIVGCGGQVPLPPGYLPKVYEYVRSLGGVCISDEVQTGFGRLGDWFWGFEMHGVVPDIVILGKPMGNGHPMAAVITTEEIAKSFETGMEFFSSFGGNTVSCAVGSAVLEVIEDEGLQENAAEVGGHLLEGLRGLVEKFETCADARGSGLFLGLELAEPGPPPVPATALASRVKNRLRSRGILVGTDGPFDNVIKIKPPLCFTKENAEHLVAALEDAISEG